MDSKACRDQFERLLIEESSELNRLEALLEKEHEFIRANDLERLGSAGDERQACIGSLFRIEDERRSLCRAMNVAPDMHGLEKLLMWCDPTRKLTQRWAECADRAGRCRSLNDRNGALVTARLRRVEGLLGVITKQTAPAPVYGKEGAYRASRAGQVLATRA